MCVRRNWQNITKMVRSFCYYLYFCYLNIWKKRWKFRIDFFIHEFYIFKILWGSYYHHGFLFRRGWEQREMACFPNKDKKGTTWNVEGHSNDRGTKTCFIHFTLKHVFITCFTFFFLFIMFLFCLLNYFPFLSLFGK